MRNKLGTAFIILGILFLCSALGLYLYNANESARAMQTSQDALIKAVENIPLVPNPEALAQQLVPPELLEPEDLEMTEVIIDGYGYIGILSIPSIQLELPVMGDWDYERLKIAPCRYYGNTKEKNLVIMAHNYEGHFRKLEKLKSGESVVFTDMDGISTEYLVEARDVLPPESIEEMTAGDFPLTLFTCTYTGESRIAIYCNEE